jgi:hypothetical protein
MIKIVIIFTHPSSHFQSKFVFKCANNVCTLRVMTFNIWAQIVDRYVTDFNQRFGC